MDRNLSVYYSAGGKELLPLLVFVDVSMMSIILIGASHHLEQQSIIKSMMIMPVSLGQILCAKIARRDGAYCRSRWRSASLALLVIHGVVINYAMLLFAVVLGGAARGHRFFPRTAQPRFFDDAGAFDGIHAADGFTSLTSLISSTSMSGFCLFRRRNPGFCCLARQ